MSGIPDSVMRDSEMREMPDPGNIKSCRDCRYNIPHERLLGGSDPDFDRCGHHTSRDPAQDRWHLGKPPLAGGSRFCSAIRSSDRSDACGPRAQWFEPKPGRDGP